MALFLSKKPERVTLKESSGNSKTEFYSSSEIRAGALIVLSVALLFFLLFMSGKSQLFQDTYRIQILFNYIGGLAKNAPVHLAGKEVGQVADIRFVGSPDGRVAVTVAVSKEAVITKDAGAFIDALGFMGEKFIEIIPGSPESPALGENETLRGIDPIPLIDLIKKGTQIADEFEKTANSMQALMGDLNQIVGENRAQLDGTIANLNEASKNLKEMTADLKLHPWKLLKKSDSKKKRFLVF